MNITELKRKLSELEVNPGFYSLDGEQLPDRVILKHAYNYWEVYYFSEKGTEHDLKRFYSEEEACLHMYDIFFNSFEAKRKRGEYTAPQTKKKPETPDIIYL